MPCVPIRVVPTGELACRVVRTRRRSWGDTLANGAAWRRASVPDEHDAVAQLFLHLAHARLERLAEQTLEPADHLVLHLVVVTGGDLQQRTATAAGGALPGAGWRAAGLGGWRAGGLGGWRAGGAGGLAGWGARRLAGWGAGRLADWGIGRLVGWGAGRLADLGIGRLAGWGAGRLGGREAGGLGGWGYVRAGGLTVRGVGGLGVW